MEGGASREPTLKLTGTTVGRFEVGRLLGRGAFGEVYRAEDSTLKRTVALKRILPALRADPEYRRRLLREAESASRLNDQNIASLYDVLEVNDETFLVMEYVEGSTLRQCLGTPMPQSQFLGIATQCARALDVSHSQGVIHRDIKPDNIMLTPSGQVKICDFGLARRVPSSNETAPAPSGITGTPGYMAPETLQGWEPDALSDIFSLGVVFYEMLGGRRPFGNLRDRFEGHAGSDRWPQRLSEINATVSVGVERVTEKMLQANPRKRIASAGEVLRELGHVDHPEGARRPLPWQMPKGSRAGRALAAVAGLLVLGVAAFLGRTWWGAPSPAGPPVRVLIADFTNHTGDSYFEYTVRESLAIALQQSKAFAVLPRRQTLETLERMQLSAEDLNAQVFQEVALRANAGILISGEIDLTADGFLILLRAVDPRTDMPIALFTQSLSGKEELPIAIDRLSARLGQELAGTDLDDDQDIPPFAEVTTRSTDALERFTRALALRDEGRVPESVVLLKSAVEIDPEFAIAHGQLAIGQALVDRDAALQSAARAFAMRDRVGQREQHLIAATYHFLRSEFADAEQNYSAIALLYPDDAYVLRYLVQVRTELGQYQEAIDAATRLHQLEPENSFDHQITILVLVEAGRFEEALAAAQFARTRGFVGPTLERAEGLALLGQGMIPEARRLFADASTGLERNSASLYTSQSLLYEGRLEEAARTLESDLVLDLEVSGGRFGGARRYWLADTYRLMNRPDEALAQAMVLAAEEVSLTRIHQLRAAGVIFSQLGELDRARSVLERVERLGVESASPLVAAAAAQIQGEIARSERRDQDARYSLERANALWPFPAATWSLATLMESQGEYEEALALYAGIIGRKGAILRWDPSTLWVLAHLHAAGCLQAMGRFAEANRYRQEFDRLWESSNDFVRLPAPETQRSEAPNVPGLAFSAFYAR